MRTEDPHDYPSVWCGVTLVLVSEVGLSQDHACVAAVRDIPHTTTTAGEQPISTTLLATTPLHTPDTTQPLTKQPPASQHSKLTRPAEFCPPPAPPRWFFAYDSTS